MRGFRIRVLHHRFEEEEDLDENKLHTDQKKQHAVYWLVKADVRLPFFQTIGTEPVIDTRSIVLRLLENERECDKGGVELTVNSSGASRLPAGFLLDAERTRMYLGRASPCAVCLGDVV